MGDIDDATAIAAAIGRKVDVVAVFDVSSVKNIIKVTAIFIYIISNDFSGWN